MREEQEIIAQTPASPDTARQGDGAPAGGRDPEKERVSGPMQVIDEMPMGFFICRTDEAAEILYANGAMLHILGCGDMAEFRELTGNSFRGLVHPDDLAAALRSVPEEVSDSRYDLERIEYRVVRRDGQTRWVEDCGRFVRSETMGDIFCIFVSDITEKRLRLVENRRWKKEAEDCGAQMEEIHQEHTRRLEIIEGLSVDYASIFYADLDADTIQAYRTSSRIRHTFGRAQSAAQSFSAFASEYIQRWVCPEDREVMKKALDPVCLRARLAEQQVFLVNYRVLQQNRLECLQLQAVKVNNRLSQIVLGVRSIDEELRNERKKTEVLADALRQSQAAVVAKNAFLSNMSHDIRTPMNAIVGFTALARKHIDDQEKLRGYLDMITISSDQLLQLLSDVLEISRIEAGRSRLDETACDLREIAEEARATLLPRAVEKRIALTTDIRRLTAPGVLADRPQLCQVLVRLVSNAVKYTAEGGHVSILLEELPSAAKGYGLYRFTVADDGIGISKAFLPHIFEPFERQANTTMSGVYGTGLGLPIVKSLVDMMGGNISVESEPGCGSRFSVTFSLRVQQGAPRAAAPPARPAHWRPGSRRILVAEDNELNREIASELLRDAGFQVEMAQNGSEALERIAASRPGDFAMVLMDLQMPVMDGCQAARAIRALPDPELSGIPIIALSANAFEEDQRMSLESGMNGHLAKPIYISQLMETLSQVFGEEK